MPEITTYKSLITRCLILFFIFMGLLSNAFAQESLSLSAAIETALKYNYSIQVTRNEAMIAGNNNSVGNAGMLPRVDVTAGITHASVNTQQEYSNGNKVKQDGAATDGLSAGAHLTWTLFDGLKMFAAKSRLGIQEEASGIQLKLQIENTVATIIESYFKAVSLQQELRVLNDAIALFDERVRIAELRFQVGSGSKLDLLQAQVDRNARKSARLLLLVNYNSAIADLGTLMGKSEIAAYQLTDSMTLTYRPKFDDLKKSVPQNNYELQLGRKQEAVFKNTLKEMQSARYPMLNMNVDYNYGRTENEVGFVLLNQNQGLYGGLSLSWNIFNGRNSNREIQNAKLNLSSTALLLADTRARVAHDLYVAFNKYEADLEILTLETENAAVATENITVAMEAFRLGSISGLELKDAQNSFEAAQSRLVDARYQAKLSESTLMKLNGELVK